MFIQNRKWYSGVGKHTTGISKQRVIKRQSTNKVGNTKSLIEREMESKALRLRLIPLFLVVVICLGITSNIYQNAVTDEYDLSTNGVSIKQEPIKRKVVNLVPGILSDDFLDVASRKLHHFPDTLYVYKVNIDSTVNIFTMPTDNFDLAISSEAAKRSKIYVGLKVKMHQNDSKWLQLGKNEWTPIMTRENGRPINRLKFVKKLAVPDSVLMKMEEVAPTKCSGTSVKKCVEDASVIRELKRILEVFGWYKPDENDMMPLIVEEPEVDTICSALSTFASCSSNPDCTWRQDLGTCSKDDEYLDLTNFGQDYNKDLEFGNHNQYDANGKPKRYFVYQPSGGFNNQRKQLQSALMISRITNRTCVVPHMAAHTNYFKNYNKQRPNQMVPLQLIFNMDRIADVVDIVTVPHTMTLIEFVNFLEPKYSWDIYAKDNKSIKRFTKLSERDIFNQFGTIEADILYFANASMWNIEWKGSASGFSDRKTVLQSMMYSDRIKRTAMKVSNWMGIYNAAHVRRGDKTAESKFGEVAKQATWYASKLKIYNKITKKVYIATDEKRREFFDGVKSFNLETVFHSDIPDYLIQPFLSLFPNRVYFDILGIVEQLICTYSYRFIGSGYSTFTITILMMRKYRLEVGPIATRLPGDVAGLPISAIGNSTCSHLLANSHERAC